METSGTGEPRGTRSMEAGLRRLAIPGKHDPLAPRCIIHVTNCYMSRFSASDHRALLIGRIRTRARGLLGKKRGQIWTQSFGFFDSSAEWQQLLSILQISFRWFSWISWKLPKPKSSPVLNQKPVLIAEICKRKILYMYFVFTSSGWLVLIPLPLNMYLWMAFPCFCLFIIIHCLLVDWAICRSSQCATTGRGMYYSVCGMMHINDILLLIGNNSRCGGSGFPFSLSEWSFIWRHITVNKICWVRR